ncbi:MAG: recombination mediator RecR [Eubacteriales bacterium]|nr:recombination mediator RecR [Eubacteriales bacterium]MDY4897995.1 recombination mediator RecR [Eubacteriales bacterium]
MADYIETLAVLAEQFGRLQGVGRKSAMRMAFSVLDFTEAEAEQFATAILDAKRKIHLCPVCMNLTDRELCPICEDAGRDRSVICVVEDVRVLMAIEKVREYRGVYHVLHGAISPVAGVTPDKIRLAELLGRLRDDSVKEVILATDPDVEGEATAMYISRLIKPLGIKVSRLAYGVPVGGDLEYADEITLSRAIDGRKEY